MKMSVLSGLALIFGLGILLSACGSNVGRPLGGDAPYIIWKTDFATRLAAPSARFHSRGA